MLKTICAVFSILLFTSCAPKEALEEGGFSLPEPQVKSQRHGREYDFNDSRLETEVTLDAEDILVLRPTGQKFQLKVSSECLVPIRDAEKTDVQRFPTLTLTRHSPKQIRLLEMLPPEAIVSLQGPQDIVCKMQFVASDADGSSHRFFWPQIKIGWQSSPKLKLQLPAIPYIGYSDRARLRFDVDQYANYQLHCGSMAFPARNLSNDVANVETLAPTLSFSHLETSNLSCRVLQRHPGGGVFAYSQKFHITPDSVDVPIVSDLDNLRFDAPVKSQTVLHRWLILQSEVEPLLLEFQVSEPQLLANETVIHSYHRRKTTQVIPAEFRLNLSVVGAVKTEKLDPLTTRAVIAPNTQASILLQGTRKIPCATSNGIQLNPENSLRIRVRVLRNMEAPNSGQSLITERFLTLRDGHWIQGPAAIHARQNKGEKYSEQPGGKILKTRVCPRQNGIGI